MPIFLHRNSPELKDSHVACFNNRQKVFVHAILKLCIRDASGFETGYPDFHSLAKYNCYLIRFINSSWRPKPQKSVEIDIKLDWKWKLVQLYHYYAWKIRICISLKEYKVMIKRSLGQEIYFATTKKIETNW